jgi:hypothetical protein
MPYRRHFLASELFRAGEYVPAIAAVFAEYARRVGPVGRRSGGRPLTR